MSLSLALSNALSGLNVNKQALSTLSQNITNANTKGYSRKLIEQSASYINGIGTGVRIEDIARKVDGILRRSIQRQNSDVNRTETIADFADRIQLLLGKPGSGNSMDAYVNNFFSTLQALAETPERASYRLNAINTASTLARQMSTLARGIENLRFEADNNIAAAVTDLNKSIRDLHGINTAISSVFTQGQSVAELYDRRDKLIDEIGKYVDMELFYKEDGQVQIFAGGGVSILDENAYELSYSKAVSVDTLINGGALAPVYVYRLQDGERVGAPAQLITGGTSENVTSGLTSGSMKAYMDLRDTRLTNMLAHLDELAAKLRDNVNRVHNKGTGYPAATQLTGTRPIFASDALQWAGKTRIALIDKSGQPVQSPWNEAGGMLPLTLDLSSLDSGGGTGVPDMQTIIDEINQHYGVPQNKVSLGNINNIRLASQTSNLPGTPAQFVFDFDLENISARNADFFVSDISILDDTGADITAVTSTIPSVTLASTNSFQAVSGSQEVTVTTSAAHGFVEGERIYLGNPGTFTVGGIDSSELTGYFTISNVTSTTFTIVAQTAASANDSENVTGIKGYPKYDTVDAGDMKRTRAEGKFTADLTGNSASLFYTIQASVAVDDGNGNFKTSIIEYRVYNNTNNLLNKRYSATDKTGDAVLTAPNTTQALMRAQLVDANGVEIGKTGGRYNTGEQGYLRLVSTSSDYTVAIDPLDSQEQGDPDVSPQVSTGRDFSFYFGLNNFFNGNTPTTRGDTLKNSAINLGVESRLLSNPNLISVGKLSRKPASADPDDPPYYTYQRNAGDNSIAQQLSELGIGTINFDAAGYLASSSISFNAYVGEILGNAAADATSAQSDFTNQKVLFDGFSQREAAISGVNLDEEVANTVIYQNAFGASARVITVVSAMFDELLRAV